MTTEAVSEALLQLASRLGRMPLASRRDPHRPHEERSEIVRALEILAREVDPRGRTRGPQGAVVAREVAGERRLASVDAAHRNVTRDTR